MQTHKLLMCAGHLQHDETEHVISLHKILLACQSYGETGLRSPNDVLKSESRRQ